jgi:hypothetical protein
MTLYKYKWLSMSACNVSLYTMFVIYICLILHNYCTCWIIYIDIYIYILDNIFVVCCMYCILFIYI